MVIFILDNDEDYRGEAAASELIAPTCVCPAWARCNRVKVPCIMNLSKEQILDYGNCDFVSSRRRVTRPTKDTEDSNTVKARTWIVDSTGDILRKVARAFAEESRVHRSDQSLFPGTAVLPHVRRSSKSEGGTRMAGGVGAGRQILPATRFGLDQIFLKGRP